MYFWKSSGSKPARSGRRPNRRAGLTLRESDKMIVKEGYWANYWHKVLVCAAGGVSSLGLLIGISHHIVLMGAAAPLYFGFLILCLVTSVVLPFYWARNYRHMMAVFEEDEEDDLDEGQAPPIDVDEEFVLATSSEEIEEATEKEVEVTW